MGTAFFRPSLACKLIVNSKDRGNILPAGVRLSLPPGRHNAVFRVEGFLAIEKNFDVKPGALVEVRADFPPRGRIQITINPEAQGAEVFLNGFFLGKAPLAKVVPAGAGKLEVRLPGFQSDVRDVEIPEEENVRVSVELKRRG